MLLLVDVGLDETKIKQIPVLWLVLLVLLLNALIIFPNRHYLSVTEKYKDTNKELDKKNIKTFLWYVFVTFILILIPIFV